MLTVARFFIGLAITHANILSSCRSIPTHVVNFTATEMLPYPPLFVNKGRSHIFGIKFSLDKSSARTL